MDNLDKALAVVKAWRADNPSDSPVSLAILAHQIADLLPSPTVAELAEMAPMLTGGEKPIGREGGVLVRSDKQGGFLVWDNVQAQGEPAWIRRHGNLENVVKAFLS